MSKIGSKLISIPATVTVSIDKQKITIKGKEDQLVIEFPTRLRVVNKDNQLVIETLSNDKKTHSWHGLFRQLIYNAVVGVEKPWEKKLEVFGTGYNVKLQGQDLVFKLGFSHPVVFKTVPGIKFQVDGNNKLTVLGANKQLVGEIAYQIKLIKKPDSYKGKGIRYAGEIIKLKPSKKVKATGAVGAA